MELTEISQELYRRITENNLPIFRYAVCVGDQTVMNRTRYAGDGNNVYSVSKSFTAAVVGMLVDRGVLSLDTKVEMFFEPQNPALWETLDPRWRDVTVRHLLTHTTGHGKMFLDMDCDNIFLYGTEDFLTKVLTEPLVFDPGTHFAYSDSNYYLLSRVVAAATGETLQSFAARELFRPLQIQGWAWSTCPHGHAMGATRLFIDVQDMLRFGILLRDGGVYGGKRILSEKFVREATSPQVRKDEKSLYGYGYWLREGKESSFYCGGMYGQKIFVNRANGLVVAWQAYDPKKVANGLFDYVYSL